MNYSTVICDECGTVKKYYSNYSDKQIEEILNNHPEWYMTVMEN